MSYFDEELLPILVMMLVANFENYHIFNAFLSSLTLLDRDDDE